MPVRSGRPAGLKEGAPRAQVSPEQGGLRGLQGGVHLRRPVRRGDETCLELRRGEIDARLRACIGSNGRTGAVSDFFALSQSLTGSR